MANVILRERFPLVPKNPHQLYFHRQRLHGCKMALFGFLNGAAAVFALLVLSGGRLI